MKRLVDEAHKGLREHLRPGDTVIDATAGNGHDTAFLARAVGPTGRVIAIDRQDSALEATQKRLEANGLPPAECICGCHAEVLGTMATEYPDRIAAIVFNLGYLPGSDKRIRTAAGTTRRALNAAGQLLRGGGLLSVLAYTGHAGGDAEAVAVAEWMHDAEAAGWKIGKIDASANPETKPPVLWFARRAVPRFMRSSVPKSTD